MDTNQSGVHESFKDIIIVHVSQGQIEGNKVHAFKNFWVYMAEDVSSNERYTKK